MLKNDPNVKNASVKNGWKIYKYINTNWAFLAGMTQSKQKALFSLCPSSRTISKATKNKKVKKRDVRCY